jgi:hypothetical protein
MIPLLTAAISFSNDSDFASATNILFQKMANRLLLNDPQFDVQSMAELQGTDATLFVNNMLKAVDAFML